MSNETEILPNLMREDPFEVVMRGYNRRQVDDYVTRSRNQIRDLEERLARALDEVEQMRREITEVRNQTAPAKPQHEEVSERLAQILALAEEEATQKRTHVDTEIGQIRTDAEEEARRLVSEANDEAENIRSSAQSQAEQTVGAANTEADRLITGSREEADRTLETARGQAEEALGDAERRASTINEGASRRLESLTATHTEAVRRLTEVHDVLGNLLHADGDAGPFDRIGSPPTSEEETGEGAEPAVPPHGTVARQEDEGTVEPMAEEAAGGDESDETDVDQPTSETSQIPIVTEDKPSVKPADDEDFDESVRIIRN